ncbi:MAG: rod shape-determining protein MreD [Bacteroidales bacterium]|nr:rod shape-determining protein MreD [Bacteroidales bacterium]
MNKDILLGFLHFILIGAFQVFILNGMHFVGYINPIVYVWFILMLPTNTPKWAVLLLSFSMGIAVDIFAGYIGLHCAILTFIGFIRPLFINIFFSGKEIESNLRPSIAEMGLSNFLPYLAILVFIHHFLYFTFEIFSFAEFFKTLLRITISSVSTILIILLLDFLLFRQKK